MIKFNKAVVLILLILGSLASMLPFYLMLNMSLKSPTELNTTSVWAPPVKATLDNYIAVLTNPNISFAGFLKNTVVITFFSTLGAIFSATLVAFGFARLRFKGRDRWFILLLSTMMLPGVVTMIPGYTLFKTFGWIDTYLPLIVPAYFGGGAFNIFLLRQYMMGIPFELDEAAKLDGASSWTIYRQVIMPLCGPALATVGIFSFLYNWRDFMGPLIYVNSNHKQTLEVGLSAYNSLRSQEWHFLMAGAVMTSLPLIAIFLLGQRYFVKGIALTGGK